MYVWDHSPLGGGGQGSAQGDGVTGEDHTQKACHGVSYQGAYPQRALIGAGGWALHGVLVGVHSDSGGSKVANTWHLLSVVCASLGKLTSFREALALLA